jgi:hypothetical protein
MIADDFDERDKYSQFSLQEVRQRMLMFGAVMAFIVIVDVAAYKGIAALLRWIF